MRENILPLIFITMKIGIWLVFHYWLKTQIISFCFRMQLLEPDLGLVKDILMNNI